MHVKTSSTNGQAKTKPSSPVEALRYAMLGRRAPTPVHVEARPLVQRLRHHVKPVRPSVVADSGSNRAYASAPVPITVSASDASLAARLQGDGRAHETIPPGEVTPGLVVALGRKPPPQKHSNGWLGGLFAVATGVLTVVDIVQLGLDPVTDGATAATGAAADEAFAGDAVETTVLDTTAADGLSLARADGRDALGRFTGPNGYGASGEAQGLSEYATATGRDVVGNQVRATLPDGSIRYYDGLALKEEGRKR